MTPAKGQSSMSDGIEVVLRDIRDGMNSLRDDVKELVRPVERHGVKIHALEEGQKSLEDALYGNGREGLVAEIQRLRNSVDMHILKPRVPAVTKSVDYERIGKWVVAAMAALGYLIGIN